jgi:hypothetical protein
VPGGVLGLVVGKSTRAEAVKALGKGASWWKTEDGDPLLVSAEDRAGLEEWMRFVSVVAYRKNGTVGPIYVGVREGFQTRETIEKQFGCPVRLFCQVERAAAEKLPRREACKTAVFSKCDYRIPEVGLIVGPDYNRFDHLSFWAGEQDEKGKQWLRCDNEAMRK